MQFWIGSKLTKVKWLNFCKSGRPPSRFPLHFAIFGRIWLYHVYVTVYNLATTFCLYFTDLIFSYHTWNYCSKSKENILNSNGKLGFLKPDRWNCRPRDTIVRKEDNGLAFSLNNSNVLIYTITICIWSWSRSRNFYF